MVGRLVARHLSDQLGQQVYVDNRGGAGGTIGTDIAAKAAPDGYTLLVISLAHAVNPWLYKLPYDHDKAFVPVASFGSGTNVLAVNPELPVHSVAELIALAKAEAGRNSTTRRPASAVSSISAASCSSSWPASTSCMCRSGAADRP